MRRDVTTLFLLPALAACATAPATVVPAADAQIVDTLYFGTAKPEGRVTPEEWAAFVDTVVTPHFTAGLTWWKASGQWKGNDGTLAHEETFVLQLVHAPSAVDDAAIESIVNEYKNRFQQEAVLRLRTTAGARF